MAQSDPGVVGIDFGTSTSFVAREIGRGRAEIVPLGRSHRHLASLAGYLGGGLVVGEDADMLTPDRVIRSVKSAITQDRTTVRVGGRDGTAQVDRDEVVVAIFREIAKRAAERQCPLNDGRRLRLGCPAMWLRDQRRSLLGLARCAGLSVDEGDLVEEPVAAGIAWLNNRLGAGERVAGRVLVFDMGGGTLDIAVMHVSEATPPTIAVLTSVGLPLAGDALDEAIMRDLADERELDLSALENPLQAEAHLRRQATVTKEALSSARSQTIYFPPAYYGTRLAPLRYTQERLNAAFAPQMDRADDLIRQALRLAQLTQVGGASIQEMVKIPVERLAAEVDVVLMVGGMSRVPLVRERLAAMFPSAQVNDRTGVGVDEAIVAGLADASGYNTMNMYRPALDIELVWSADHRLRLYEAYTPLFELWQLQSGQSRLGYQTRAARRDGIPRQHAGELHIRRVDGALAELIHTQRTASPATRTVDALPVPFGHRDIVVKLYCDGHIHLTDGVGHAHSIRVAGWPEIGAVEEPEPPPDPPVPYPFNRP